MGSKLRQNRCFLFLTAAAALGIFLILLGRSLQNQKIRTMIKIRSRLSATNLSSVAPTVYRPRNQAAASFISDCQDMIIEQRFKRVFMRTLMEFDRIWRVEKNFTYMLMDGSILGAYRHGGIIPFDDDVDLAVDMKHREGFIDLFRGTVLTAEKNQDFRSIFLNDGSTIPNPKGVWPYIDVFFYENNPHKKGWMRLTYHTTAHRPSELLPVQYLPFEGRMMPVPRCTKLFLHKIYGKDFEENCCTHGYSHRRSRGRRSRCIPCKKLFGPFRFTTWRRLNSTHSQQQVMEPSKSKRLSWRPGIVLPLPKC